MRALVTDDSRVMRRILTRMLADSGLETAEAEHGHAALDLLAEHGVAGPGGFDLLCIDWSMPGMNGLDLVAAIGRRPEWRQLTMLMVTSQTDHTHVAGALAAGAHEYLTKPFTAQELHDKLVLLGLVPRSGQV